MLCLSALSVTVSITNVLNRWVNEVKGRTKVIRVFLGETSASTLATVKRLRSSEE